MWANYDYSNFPIVLVKFSNTIKSDEDFRQFLKNGYFYMMIKRIFPLYLIQ